METKELQERRLSDQNQMQSTVSHLCYYYAFPILSDLYLPPDIILSIHFPTLCNKERFAHSCLCKQSNCRSTILKCLRLPNNCSVCICVGSYNRYTFHIFCVVTHCSHIPKQRQQYDPMQNG